jgi:sortase (surface protein transpeptidase)
VKLPEILQGVPRWAFLLAIPVVAFIAATAVVLSFGGDDDGSPSRTTTPLTTSNLDVAVTPTSLPATATAVPVVNREDCDTIRGTDYESPEEREWYLANCVNLAAASGGGGGGGGAPSGGGPVSGGEFALGDRLIIPSIGVNATVTGMTVGASGVMGDPAGYFNAVWYDFKSHPGIGGYTDGNLVLAAHVDCARCHNGASGQALFYNVKNLSPGSQIQYVTHDGRTLTYAIRSVNAYAPGSNWGGILASSAADMTLITCGGTWDPVAHEYSIRWAAYADLVG